MEMVVIHAKHCSVICYYMNISFHRLPFVNKFFKKRELNGYNKIIKKMFISRPNSHSYKYKTFFPFLDKLIATSHCMNNKSSFHHERHVQALTMSNNISIEYIDKHLRINSKVKLEIALGKFFSFNFYAYTPHTRPWIIDWKNNEWSLSIE